MVADYSHFALWLAGLASVAQAYTTPVGASPSGNSITKPGLNEAVPVGSPYTITWTPTTADCSTVDLILLRGPSTDIKYLSTIVEKTSNTGTYEWTPSSSLEPDTTHYGIQLICTQSGAYQYTTQFGISNPGYSGAITSTRSVHFASSSSSAAPSSAYHSSSFPVPGNSTVIHPTGTASHSIKVTHKPSTSTQVLTETNSPTVTDSPTTVEQASPSSTTGAAAVVHAGLGLVGAAAAAVYLL